MAELLAANQITIAKVLDGEMSAEQIAQLNQASEDASQAKTDVANLEIGGRNYIVKTDSFSLTKNGITVDYDGNVYHVYGTNTKTDAAYGFGYFVDRTNVFEPGVVYTVSTTTPLPSGLYLGINTRNSIGKEVKAASNSYFDGDGSKTSNTFTCIQDTNGELHCFFGVKADCGTVDVTFKIKFEKGNRATDWTPAPEDVDAGIKDAAKVATNFLEYDSTNGLIVGNKTSGSWSGYRSQILPGSFNILDESSTVLASFGPTTVIGEEAKANMHLTFNNFSMADKDGTTLFKVGDNRNAEGIATLQWSSPDVPIGTSGSTTITVGNTISSIVSVYVDSVELSSSNYSFSGDEVTINNLTANSEKYIEIIYNTTDPAYYLTFGYRRSSSIIGEYSIAEGRHLIASGFASHAEGAGTSAIGAYSHAEGHMSEARGAYSHAGGYHTVADGSYMTAFGSYNTENSGKAFVVGIGDFLNRRDGFTVDWNGNATIKGGLALGTALSIANGGTGATTAAAAQENLGIKANSERIAAIATDLNVQKSRIDTFTSLPEGSTSGNAELADIRVGSDGTTYDTAGNAVRGQISGLKSDLTDISNLLHQTTERKYLSSTMFDGVYESGHFTRLDGTVGSDNNYAYTTNLIRVNEGDHIILVDYTTIRSMRFVTAYDITSKAIASEGAESVMSYTVPIGVAYIRITANVSYFTSGKLLVQNSTTALAPDTYNAINIPDEYIDYYDSHYITSANMFDGAIVSGYGIKNDGSLFAGNNYAYTKNFIQVDSGDNIILSTNHGNRFMRCITAYDKDYKVLPDKGLGDGTYSYWTVPEGVYFIKITGYLTDLSASDCAIYQSKEPPLFEKDTFTVVETSNRTLTRMKREPLRLMPDYFKKSLSYRPICDLSKGYICIVTDDGTSGLASYTVPLAIRENIPITFAVMKNSEVFQNNNMTQTVIDAVNNHGCSLAQHGSELWDTMSEKDLNVFFDIQQEFFNSLGVETKGAVIPQHRTNDLVKAVAGARYGVVRSGYTGLGASADGDVDNGSIRNYYNYYTSGARSNIYGLSSYNCASATTEYNHNAVDYAKANNKIMIVYFHEFNTYAEQQAVVEDLIAYAKSVGLEFITLGDIPSLETWNGN